MSETKAKEDGTHEGCRENEGWNQATSSAKDAVASLGDMASGTVKAVGTLASQTVENFNRRADRLSVKAGEEIHHWGDQMSNHAPSNGVLGSAARSIARRIQEGGEYIESTKWSGMSENCVQQIRRNPVASIAIALSIGWMLGRRFRS